MIVRVIRQLTDEEIGTITVEHAIDLKTIADVDWRPLEINGRLHCFRFHGYKWDSQAGELYGILWVSEGE